MDILEEFSLVSKFEQNCTKKKEVPPSILYVLLPSYAFIQYMCISVLEKYALLPQKVTGTYKQIVERNSFCQPVYSRKTKFSTCHCHTSLYPTFCYAQERTDRRTHKEVHDMYCPWAAVAQASAGWAEALSRSQPRQWANSLAPAYYRQINKEHIVHRHLSFFFSLHLTTQEMLLMQQLLNHINLRLIKRPCFEWQYLLCHRRTNSFFPYK